jgi:hypothetical protein
MLDVHWHDSCLYDSLAHRLSVQTLPSAPALTNSMALPAIPLRQRLGLAHPLCRGELPHFLGDLHRAEMRAAHRAEMRHFGRILGQVSS